MLKNFGDPAMQKDRYLTGTAALILAAAILAGCQPSQTNTTDSASEKMPAVVQAPAEKPPVTVKPLPKIEVTADAPRIKIEKASVDFGQVGPGSNHKTEYQFTNIGKETLKIDHVQSTCGCTVPQLEKKEYAHGESGTVRVNFQAAAVKGPMTKHLYIVSNDPRSPRAELEVKADVVVKVEVSPETVDLRFDQPNAGMPDLSVRSLDNKEFSIRSITIANNVMNIPFEAAQKAASFVLKPRVDSKLLDTYSTGTIQIATDHPQSGTLLVRYTALPVVEVNRPRIILENVQPGEPVVKDVVLRSNYEKPLEIASATSKNGYMEIAADEPEGSHRKLLIRITPPDQASSARRYLTDELKITLKSGEEVTIRCSGWFKL
jgi:hypothetical protein